MSNFQSLEVVGRGSETQFQVVENLDQLSMVRDNNYMKITSNLKNSRGLLFVSHLNYYGIINYCFCTSMSTILFTGASLLKDHN